MRNVFLNWTFLLLGIVIHFKDADADDVREKLTDEAEMEGEILARLSDLIHNMFEVSFLLFRKLNLSSFFYIQTFGEAFFDCMEPLLPKFLQLVDFHRAYPSRQYGVCYIDDCIEFAPRVTCYNFFVQ